MSDFKLSNIPKISKSPQKLMSGFNLPTEVKVEQVFSPVDVKEMEEFSAKLPSSSPVKEMIEDIKQSAVGSSSSASAMKMEKMTPEAYETWVNEQTSQVSPRKWNDTYRTPRKVTEELISGKKSPAKEVMMMKEASPMKETEDVVLMNNITSTSNGETAEDIISQMDSKSPSKSPFYQETSPSTISPPSDMASAFAVITSPKSPIIVSENVSSSSSGISEWKTINMPSASKSASIPRSAKKDLYKTLEEKGISPQGMMYKNKSGPYYVVGKTRFGNTVWLKVDEDDYKSDITEISENSYLMNTNANVKPDSEMEQMLKSAKSCLKSGACNVVMECKEGFCSVDVINMKVNSDESFSVHSDNGKSPTVLAMSPQYDLSSMPSMESIDMDSALLRQQTYKHLDTRMTQLEQHMENMKKQADQLKAQIENNKQFLHYLHQSNQNDIQKLRTKLATINNKDAPAYRDILYNIVEKKELESKILNEFTKRMIAYHSMDTATLSESSGRLKELVKQFNSQVGLMKSSPKK
jgi:hypothetical protein